MELFCPMWCRYCDAPLYLYGSLSYFLTNELSCLDRTNPIGMRGHMAKCYGDLVQELWSGTQKNVAPLKLRVGFEILSYLWNYEHQTQMLTLKFLCHFLKNIFVVDNSKVCTEIQWLPAARLPGALGISLGWASWRLESRARETIRGAQG